MMRDFLGWAMVLFAPWLIWLAFVHGIQNFWSGDVAFFTTAALSYASGLAGAYLIATPILKWPSGWRLFSFVSYAVILAMAMPFVGLLSVCTTGDCI